MIPFQERIIWTTEFNESLPGGYTTVHISTNYKQIAILLITLDVFYLYYRYREHSEIKITIVKMGENCGFAFFLFKILFP